MQLYEEKMKYRTREQKKWTFNKKTWAVNDNR